MPSRRTVASPAAPAATAAASKTALPVDQESATRVLRRFRLVFNAVKTHFQQVERRAGLGGAQLWALSVVRDRPGLGVGELAKAMDIHQTTASNLVRSLTTMGLIVGEKNGADRRAVQLRVLPAGTRLLRKAPGPFAGVLPDALAKLDPAVLQRLDQDLGSLIALLDADKRAASIPLAQM